MHKLYSKLKLGFIAIAVSLGTSASVQAQTLPGNYTIKDSTWEMIVFPGIRGNRTTVADYLSATTELTSAGIGRIWGLFEFNPATQAYAQLSADDTLMPGVGYWIIQVTGSDVTIIPPADDNIFIGGLPYDQCNDNITTNDTIQKDLCTFAYLTGDVQSTTSQVWRMMGNDSNVDINFQNILNSLRISSNGGAFVPVNLFAFFGTPIWRWQGDDETFLAMHLNPTTGIPTWAGYWFNTGSLPATDSFALIQPTGETKGAITDNMRCPLDCTTSDIATPPPPPLDPAPVSYVEVIRDSVNDIQSIALADIPTQKFFTLTAGDRDTSASCAVSAIIFDGDNNNRAMRGGDEKSMDITDLEYIACAQQQLGGSDQPLNLEVPVPSVAPPAL